MARALAYRIGRPAALDRLLLTGESVAPLKDWEIPTFPIKGGDVVARGVTVGPEVSRILKSLEDRWISDGFPGFGRTSELLEEILR